MASATVKLAHPFQHFDKTIGEVEVREPRGALYTRLGEPRVMVFNASGSGYWVEQTDVVRQYLDELVKLTSPDQLGADVMSFLSLEDTKAVKEAFFGFFVAAEANLLARRRTPSSSASAQ